MEDKRNKGRASYSGFSHLACLEKKAEDTRQGALEDLRRGFADAYKQKRRYDRFIRKGLNELSLDRKYIKEIMDFYEEHFKF